jgi:hypothetical protein
MLAWREMQRQGRSPFCNGGFTTDAEHQAKWAAIRAEWAKEDMQEAQRPRFLRRA